MLLIFNPMLLANYQNTLDLIKLDLEFRYFSFD